MKQKTVSFIFIFFLVGSVFVSAQQTGMFTVYGEVFLSDGVTYVPDGNKVTIKNLNTGVTLSSAIGSIEPGKYTVTFVDFTSSRAAAVGDQLEITVKSFADKLIGGPEQYIITADDINQKKVRRDIVLALQIGDVSGDGKISAYDASLVLQHLVGLRNIIFGSKEWIAADVTRNSIISAYDATLILQYCVGLISRFEAVEANGVNQKSVNTKTTPYPIRLDVSHYNNK